MFLIVVLSVVVLALALAAWYDRRHGNPGITAPHQSREVPPRAGFPETGGGGGGPAF